MLNSISFQGKNQIHKGITSEIDVAKLEKIVPKIRMSNIGVVNNQNNLVPVTYREFMDTWIKCADVIEKLEKDQNAKKAYILLYDQINRAYLLIAKKLKNKPF